MSHATILVENRTIEVDLVGPGAALAIAAAAAAEEDAALAQAAAAAAAASETDAQAHAEAAGGYLDGVEALVAGIPLDPILPLQAINRTILAGFTGMAAGRQAWLGEEGRQGTFKWSVANHSADVTADPFQGIYVAPTSDTDGSSGAWVRQFDGVAHVEWFGAVADAALVADVWTGTDNTARFRSAIALDDVQVLVFSGRHMVDTMTVPCVDIPEGKTLRGLGRGISWLHKVPLDPLDTQASAVAVVASSDTSNIALEDFSIDVQSSGVGRGELQSCSGANLACNRRISVRRVDVWNVTGYGHWANGATDTNDHDASVHYEDCYAENCSISFEQTYCKDVLLERCISLSGPSADNDAPAVSCASHFHPYGGSDNITYRDCKGTGEAVGIDVSMALGPISELVMDNVQIDLGATSTTNALSITGGDATNLVKRLRISNSRFRSGDFGASTIEYVDDGKCIGTTFEGKTGVTLTEAPVHFSNCTAIGTSTDPTGLGVVVLDTGAWWHGGRIIAAASGVDRAWSGALVVSGEVELSPAGRVVIQRHEGACDAIQADAPNSYVAMSLPWDVVNINKVYGRLKIIGAGYVPAHSVKLQAGGAADQVIFAIGGANLAGGSWTARADVYELA